MMQTPTPTDPGLWVRIATCRIDLAHLDHDRRALLRAHAWAALRKARARRLGLDVDAVPQADTGATVTQLPRRSRHRITLMPATGPGDAA